jgi:hypothetical protein
VTAREPSRQTPPPAPARISPLPFAGMIGLACVLFVDLGSVGVLRWWAEILLLVIWLVLFVLACAWWTTRPRRLPWLAGVGLVVWVLVVVGANVATQ